MMPSGPTPGTAALDIGGANIKCSAPDGSASVVPFELWRHPGDLERALAPILEPLRPLDRLAITMTAELCDCFETKAAGVLHVLDSVAGALKRMPAGHGKARVLVWRRDRRLAPIDEARADPVPAAAANWLATAILAGWIVPRGSALLVDVGSTTADIIPIDDGDPAPAALTDIDRLISGELVYTGASRTPIAAIVHELPWRGRPCPLAKEVFATSRDAYLVLGRAREDPADFSTADGRPATRVHARARLARMLCADPADFSDEDATLAARCVAAAQEAEVAAAIETVGWRRGRIRAIVAAGSGEFLASAAARSRAETIISLSREIGETASAAAAAHALRRIASGDHRGP